MNPGYQFHKYSIKNQTFGHNDGRISLLKQHTPVLDECSLKETLVLSLGAWI